LSQTSNEINELNEGGILDKENSFGIKQDSISIMLFKDSFPKKFNPTASTLLFADIPYGNNFDYDYNKSIDLDEFVSSIKEFHKNNTIKTFTLIVFCGGNQIDELEKKLNEKFDQNCFTRCIWVKTKSQKSLFINPKGFNKSYENFIVFSTTETINSTKHELKHNDLVESFKINNLIESFESKYSSVKELPDIIKDLKKHVTSFSNYHCGSDVFFSESGDKFKIGGKILNIFEKPQGLLTRIIRSFTSEGDLVHEFCFGSGSLAEVCFKEKRNYIGYDNSQEMFVGAKFRLNRLIK
jgi:DNA modification methylase